MGWRKEVNVSLCAECVGLLYSIGEAKHRQIGQVEVYLDASSVFYS